MSKAPGETAQPKTGRRLPPSATPALPARSAWTRENLWTTAALVLVLGVVAYIRLRLLQMPLERDEGEYAYAGQLLLQGVPPYHDLYSMKWPGTFGAYALIMALFGQTIGGIHFGLLLVVLATAVLIFFIAKNIAGSPAALVAAGTCALLGITPRSFGLAAHATHFVVLPALGGILLLQKTDERVRPARLVMAGVLFSVAALMKQVGAVFGVFGAVWLVWQELRQPARRWSRLATRLAWLAAGGLGILVVTALALAAAGVWRPFWLWTTQYSRAYAGIITPAQAFHRFLENGGNIFTASSGMWALAALGLVPLFLEDSLKSWRFFLVSFLVFSFLSVCAGGYFRGHYFLLLFPAVGLLAGFGAQAVFLLLGRIGLPRWARGLPFGLFVMAAAGLLFSSRAIFFSETPLQACRAIYALNPFPESIEIGRYLETHCQPSARIAVIGSEPQLYFYSRRRSATGYVYTYPLLERQPYAKSMQQEMIHELTNAAPEYFVFVSQPSSWLPQPDSDVSIIEWFIQYRQEHLEPVGLVDIFPNGRAEYSWSGTANPRSDQWLQIYKQRPAVRGQ
jgi:hypothetical protein